MSYISLLLNIFEFVAYLTKDVNLIYKLMDKSKIQVVNFKFIKFRCQIKNLSTF